MSYLGLTPGILEDWPTELRDLAFDRDEYLGRLRRVRTLMAEQKVDVLYVTTPDHVCYLHGYFASWYKANSPMRYPQLYGTVIHVDHDEFIHFDNPTERTSTPASRISGFRSGTARSSGRRISSSGSSSRSGAGRRSFRTPSASGRCSS